ncbi:FmdB family zinc ribbon protein [Candidatus Deferrimicrobium sp.]|uniref:FmdB family zinc ribbon protein n=1 Tax=Candidatus Deferrimicrobium sp. TaxID=3060586 RepID=UPI003C5573D1
MPIHEYKCRKCEAVVERIEGMHDRQMRKCPSCGGKVDQMISHSAFVLKGTGWYATDYGTRNHDNGNGKAKGKGKGNGKGEPKAKESAEASCPAASGTGAPAACAGCPKLD